MTAYSIELSTDEPDIIYLEVDQRFNLAIERTEGELSIRVYPKSNGEIWDFPFVTFEVDEAEIEALEKEMEA